MKRDYIPKKGDGFDGMGTQLGLKASNFDFGSYQRPNFYSSTNKMSYKPQMGFVPESLNEEKKRDLRTHHFSFGKQGQFHTTNSNLTYVAHDIPQNLRFLQDEQRKKMRSHHHTFKESTKDVVSSVYNSTFNRPINSQSYSVDRNETKTRLAELRNSNIVLGKNNLPMTSVCKGSYGPKEIPPNMKADIDKTKTNFDFGSQKPDFKTTNNNSSKNAVRDIAEHEKCFFYKSESHFTLGSDKNFFNSESKTNFQQKNAENPNLSSKPILQSNHFSLGHQNTRNRYATTYNDFHKKTNGNNFPEKVDSGDRSSNFQLGNIPMNVNSEMKSHFKNPDVRGTADLAPEHLNELRNSHFAFSDCKGQYQTTSKNDYRGRSRDPNSLNSHDLKNKFQTSSINIGNDSLRGNTTYRHYYVKHQNARGRTFDSHELRKSHFNLG